MLHTSSHTEEHASYLEGRGVGKTGNSSGLNAALVNSAEDEEESVHTPGGAPRVGNSPVLLVVEGSPANHLDGVSSSERASLVDVDSRRVREEVLVDIEGNLDGSVGHDLSLEGLNGAAESIGRGSLVVLDRASARGAGGVTRLELAVSGDTASRGVGVAVVRDNAASRMRNTVEERRHQQTQSPACTARP